MIQDKNILLIIISQTRDKIDSMFKEQTRAGGKALDFYAHTALWLASVQQIEKKGRVVGVVIKAHAKKNKTPRPFRKCMFTFLFDYGVDNVGSNIDFLFDLRTDRGALKTNESKSIIWDDKAKAETFDNVKQFMEESGLMEEYKKIESKMTKGAFLDWIEADEKRIKKYDAVFGAPMSRKELICYIEENNLQSELTRRVREKWEDIEKSIQTVRKPKFQLPKS